MKKIAVIGAGIIGITTAYEIALKGHEVTIFDQNSACAEEASFANGSIFAPNFVSPWTAPGLPKYLFKQLLTEHSPVRFGGFGRKELAWVAKWRSACKMDSYLSHRSQLHNLAVFSKEVLQETTRKLNLDYERTQGLMVLFRTQEERKNSQPSLQIYKEMGVLCSEMSPLEVRTKEPALNTETPLSGGLYFPEDGVANCRQYALLLKEECERLGVVFKFNSKVSPLTFSQPTLIQTQEQSFKFDEVVICSGTQSSVLLSPLNINIPLLPIFGYTLSASIREHIDAPLSAVMDDRYKVTISKMGQRIRVSGISQIGGSSKNPIKGAYKSLYKMLNDWFPGGARTSESVQEWCGARASLPEGVPLIGSTKVPGIWLNVGHGASGWTLSCGAAKAVANLINDELPGINLVGFGVSRLE
jgi:D-amino-acid dehydrogenase